MSEGSQRILGRDASDQHHGGLCRSQHRAHHLGPKGMDKMLVSDLGDIVITNDGATILEEMNVRAPRAKIMGKSRKRRNKGSRDGTTTAVLLSGMLLKKAGDLLDQDITPPPSSRATWKPRRKSEEFSLPLHERVDYRHQAAGANGRHLHGLKSIAPVRPRTARQNRCQGVGRRWRRRKTQYVVGPRTHQD